MVSRFRAAWSSRVRLARSDGKASGAAALCLYEDGTPPRWLSGADFNECFEHVSFSERFSRAYAARPAGGA